MDPTLGFDTEQRSSFLIKFGVFLQLKQDSDNIFIVNYVKIRL
jgi:hypothetical protein